MCKLNQKKNHKKLIAIVEVLSNKKPERHEWLNCLFVIENLAYVFITHSYFAVLRIQNDQKLQQNAINYSPDTDFDDFMKNFKK